MASRHRAIELMKSENPKRPLQEPATITHVRLTLEGSRLWLALVGMLILIVAPWGFLWSERSLLPAGYTHSSPGKAAGAVAPSENHSEGPWGQLETTDIVIAPPLEFVDAMTADRTSTDWHMPGINMAQFSQFLARLPIREDSRSQILALSRAVDEGIVVSPSDELIWALTPEERGALYRTLALYPANLVQLNAFRFSGTAEQWLSGSGIREETFELVEKLVYQHGKLVFLADIQPLMERIERREQSRLLKALAGEHTLAVRLRVTANDNIAELVEYWGRGRRAKDVRPILESLSKVPGGGSIDVAHLLPAFARMRLYTYPRPATPDDDAWGWHCHWTAMNFFSAAPDQGYSSLEAVVSDLKAKCHPIYRNPALGDLVIFSDKDGEMFHSAVYVADDIVFTKNGPSFSRPWMYMRMDQMKDFYPRPVPVEVHFYRWNEL
jgi:hypothetical protein